MSRLKLSLNLSMSFGLKSINSWCVLEILNVNASLEISTAIMELFLDTAINLDVVSDMNNS
jgi:hypothetical protein